MPEFVIDGTLDFLGGQDASKVPDKIPKNCYASGVNVSTKNGVLSPRPGIQKLNLEFEGSLILPNLYERSYEAIFRTGVYQAVIPYAVGLDYYLIYVIAGIIFLANQDTGVVSVLNIEDGSMLDETRPRVNWSYGGNYVFIFDYPAYPVIIEGVQARRADPDEYEVPISRLGAYNQNRLFIINGGNEFTAGDPTGSLAAPNAPSTFQELLLPNSPYYRQIFQLPTSLTNEGVNEIRAAAFLQFTDTSTGIGPLLLATSKAIYSFQTQLPRDQWEAGQFGTALTYNSGIAGARAFANVNSDLFYISADGQLRTLSMSRNEQGRWSKVAISREVQNWIKFYDKDLIPFSVVGYFANKIMVAVNPYRTKAKTQQGFDTWDVAHAGYVVIELDNISTLTAQSPPVWAGLWTGVRPMDFCINNNRCFIISKDEGNQNHVWEMTPDVSYDRFEQKIRDIRSKVYFREYEFESPFQDKSLHSLSVNLAAIKGKFNLKAMFKPSHAAKFKLWRDLKINVKSQDCDIPVGANGYLAFEPGSLNLGGPEEGEECDESTQKSYSRFRKVQLFFELIGRYWELHEVIVRAIMQPQNENADIVCEELGPIEIEAECDDDWRYEYL